MKKKSNLFFKNNKKYSWSQSHSWAPVVIPFKKNTYKVFYSSRNKDNFSQTGYFIFNIKNKKILKNSSNPIICLGKAGEFDDSLALGSALVKKKNDLFFYYVGWTRPKNTRYLPSIGLAISKDGGKTFKKLRAPIIGRTNLEPYGSLAPTVIKDKTVFKMWYPSIKKWTEKKGSRPVPVYNVSYATSKDGINWSLKKINVLKNKNNEIISRPWVLKIKNKYHMWFSYRTVSSKFRICYAYSSDGLNWRANRKSIILKPAKKGWDSEMVEYPCVFTHKNEYYMMYNGNGYGKTGIGLIKLNQRI